MEKLLYADLGGATLAESLASAGSDFSWPTLIQGTKVKLGFRLVEEVDGEYVEVEREITSIRAKIGDLYAQPESGTYRLHIGPVEDEPVAGTNLTAEIAIGASAAAVQTALNDTSIVGTTYGAATVTAADGSYFITFAGETEAVPLRGANIRTDVISFIRVWASAQDGIWTLEVRPDKAGIAFADQTRQELPPPPVVTEFRAGVDNGDGTGINEIQKIEFNSRFRGLYEVRWGGLKSALLNRDDGPDQFATAIAPLAEEDGRFIVTNPSPQVGLVEFAGSMGAQPQAELEIAVVDSPEGDLWVTLDLGAKTCADVLRQMELDDTDEVTVPFEIEIRYDDPGDEEETLVWAWQQPVTVRRRAIRDGESLVNDTDYTRPVNSRSYRAFNASQVAAGVHFFPFELGNGVSDEFTVDHGLGTLLVAVDLRENAPGGRFLVHGTDYQVAYDDEGTGEDSVVITLLGDYASDPPAAGELIGVVVGREQVSHFEEDVTWEIDQINGLQDQIDALWAEITALRALAPTGVALTTTTAGAYSYPLRPVFAVLPSRISVEAPETLATWNPSASGLQLGRLLPAVHDAVVEDLATTLPTPSADLVGRVFEAQADRDDVGEGLRAGDFAACDGEVWYRVEPERVIPAATFTANTATEKITASHRLLRIGDKVRVSTTGTLPGGLAANTDYYVITASGGVHQLSATKGGSAINLTTTGTGTHTITWQPTSSYYPTAFEIPLFVEAITADELTLRSALSLQFGFEAQLLAPFRKRRDRAAEATYTLIVEAGGQTAATSPGTPAENWEDNDWSVVMIEKAIALTETPRPFRFGIEITRSLVGGVDTLTANKIVSRATTATEAPDSLPFLLRARLVRFDVRDVLRPRGLVAVRGLTVGLDGADDPQLGRLTVG